MVPSIIVVFIWANFIFPFNPGSIVQINFFAKGMSALDPNITVSFMGWIAWWLVFTNAYIVLWILFVKFVLRFKYPEIAIHRWNVYPQSFAERLGFHPNVYPFRLNRYAALGIMYILCLQKARRQIIHQYAGAF